jgi:hypothetical protein
MASLTIHCPLLEDGWAVVRCVLRVASLRDDPYSQDSRSAQDFMRRTQVYAKCCAVIYNSPRLQLPKHSNHPRPITTDQNKKAK